MKTYARLVLSGFLLLGLVACEKDNAVNPDAPGMACSSDTECTSGVCNTETSECVACLPDKDQACTGPTPVCGGTTCRGCQAHSECDSDACLPDGTCAAEAAVIYLRAGGSGIGQGEDCLKGEPCGRLETAINLASATRPYIRVTGTIEDSNRDVVGKTVTFLGSPNSVLRGGQIGGGTDEPILDLRGAAMVTIYDLAVRDGRRSGIRLDEGSAVTLHRSKVVSCSEEGVLISSGKATIATQSEISANGNGGGTRRGVSLVVGELVVERSKISDNGGGGIVVADNQKFTITNSFITGNRVGGGLVTPATGAGSKFEFNTVADNADTGTGVADAGGIFCEGSFTFANNIIFRNTGGNGGSVQTAGACTYGNSLVSSNSAPETRVLGFVKDTVPRDYHLTAASPGLVKDVAGVTCSGVDYDGETRPQGSACDLGADELKQ
jgi:Right handed beta helix region